VSHQLEELSRDDYGLQFDPGTGICKFEYDVLFDTGSAELKPGAKQRLRRLARVLNSSEASNLKAMVVGHTDDQQVAKKPVREQYPNNFHLSSARALAVADVLRDAGLPEDRLAVAGFASHQPIAPNATSPDRQKNRRVEIFVMAPEVPVVGWAETDSDLY
jgi:chemotaxis protein MotB